MKKVKFGIIGLGNQGSSYVFNIFNQNKIENGEISALCDTNQAKIDNVKSQITGQNVSYFTDYKEMLDSGLVDAVLVEVPHYFHPEIVIECLKRDINVICEKPAGVYTKQVREMNEVAKNSKALFGMMFNQRTNCVYRKMREIIKEGGLGELQRVNWVITTWFRPQKYYDTGSWRASWVGEGGGVLINQSPHQLDLISWILGEMPTSVRGFGKFGKWHDIEVEDDVTAYFEYKNGATGVFITSTGETPGTNRLEISGTKGKLCCTDDKLVWYKNLVDGMEFSKTTTQAFGAPDVEVIEVETDGKNPQHQGIINNFANAILGLEPLMVDGAEGINGVELMNAIELSAWNNGKEIILPVDEDEYLEELNKRRKTSKMREVKDEQVVNTAGTYGSKK